MGKIIYILYWGGRIMLEVTDTATTQIAEYFKDKDVAPIRIFLNEGGWGGPGLAMALDEPKDTDNVFDIDGYKYIVNKEFMDKVQPVKVDFLGFGFKLSCAVEFGQSGGGCSGCGTDSSCGSWQENIIHENRRRVIEHIFR